MSHGREPQFRARALGRVVGNALRPAVNALQSLASWVRLESSGGVANSLPTSDTAEDTLQRAEPYGIASRPPAGSVGLAIAVGGEQEQRVVILTTSPAGRPATAEGDVALYSSAGNKVVVLEAGDVLVVAKDGSKIYLGEDTGTDPIAMSTPTRAELNKIVNLLKTWTVAPNDGGLALKNAAIAAFPSGAADVGSSTVEAKP